MTWAGIDFAIPVALIISMVNTIFQIAWNDKRDDIWEWGLWVASYVVGISSNYMGLILVLNMSDPMMEKILSLSLGAMIEIGPEKLLLRGLRELKASGSPMFKSNKPNNNGPKFQPFNPNQPSSNPSRPAQPPNYRSSQQPQGKPNPQVSNRPVGITKPQNQSAPVFHFDNEEE